MLFEVGGRPLAAHTNDNFQIVRRAGDAYSYYPLDLHVHRFASLDITPLPDRPPWLGLLSSAHQPALPIVDTDADWHALDGLV